MTKVFASLILLVLTLPFLSGQNTTFSKVKIHTNTHQDIDRLASLGIPVYEHWGSISTGIIVFLSEEEMTLLQDSEYTFDLIIPDVQSDYEQRLRLDKSRLAIARKGNSTADNFGYGSMGGFYTLAEVEAKLDSMHILFPDIASEKFSIGQSIEGRDIWAVKISDNHEVDEDESVIHYDALHHAREPLSMAVTMNYAFWLLENYQSDPQVQYIIDNREIFIVPVVNPDGYLYNEQIAPNGGGLWRKNRVDNGNGCFGVDLNRNYGYQFGFNGQCASSDPCRNTYKGDDAFSEPESVAIRDFVAMTGAKVGFSIHSTAGSYLMPYGYNTEPPDYDMYSEWALDCLHESDYPYGTTFEMLGYTSCGTTRDFFQSEGIFMWTPEIRGSGFWPMPSEIFELVEENVLPLFYHAWIAGGYADVQSHHILDDLLPGGTAELMVEIKNKGIGEACTNVQVEILSHHMAVSVSDAMDFPDIPVRETVDNAGNPFIVSVNPEFEDVRFDLEIRVSQNGVHTTSETITVYVGEKNVLFYDDAENGDALWTASGNGISWGVNTDDSYSGDYSFGDSDDGNSMNNTTNHFAMNQTVDLTEASLPILSFNGKWALESGDRVTLDVSLDSGSTWVPQLAYRESQPWHQEFYDLSIFTSFDKLLFRFTMHTNNNIPADGFYFDDFSIVDYVCCDVTSIHGMEEIHELIIVPNPVGDQLFIRNTNDIGPDAIVEIFDLSGRRVESAAIGQFSVDVGHLVRGLYIIRLTDGNQVFSDRFVKN